MAESLGPAVILQDLVMPRLDGLSLIRSLSKKQKHGWDSHNCAVGKGRRQVKSQAFEAGTDDYLVKLPDPIELIARIRYHSRSFVTTRKLKHTYSLL